MIPRKFGGCRKGQVLAFEDQIMHKKYLTLLALLFIAGCANQAPLREVSLAVTACAADAPVVLDGAVEIPKGHRANTVRNMAEGEPGAGGMCNSKVFYPDSTIEVYRAYDTASHHSKFGRWWSFEKPAGEKASYREANAICPEWSKLDAVVMCRIKPGTYFAVGTTQSAQCETQQYGTNAAVQVYIPNSEDALLVEDCQPLGAW